MPWRPHVGEVLDEHLRHRLGEFIGGDGLIEVLIQLPVPVDPAAEMVQHPREPGVVVALANNPADLLNDRPHVLQHVEERQHLEPVVIDSLEQLVLVNPDQGVALPGRGYRPAFPSVGRTA